MKHIKVLELSEANRLKLEKGYHNDSTRNYVSLPKEINIKAFGHKNPLMQKACGSS